MKKYTIVKDNHWLFHFAQYLTSYKSWRIHIIPSINIMCGRGFSLELAWLFWEATMGYSEIPIKKNENNN